MRAGLGKNCRSHASRVAEAVETAMIICPLRIAKIGGAAGQRVGMHRRPGVIGRGRAGFDYDDPVAGTSYGKPKPVRTYAEARTAGLHLRVPQHGRTPAKRRVPPRGPRQVIDGCNRVTGEQVRRIRSKAGGVALEVGCRQVIATQERMGPDTGDAARNRDVGQAGARKRVVPDAGDAVADSDAGQARARERSVPDAGDAVGDRQVRQAAVNKRAVLDAGDFVADNDAGEVGAVPERIDSDAGDRVAIHRARDGHSTAGTSVFGDGDRTVVSGVQELGFHRGGQP